MTVKPFECIQLVDPSHVKRVPSQDWRRWPEPYRKAAEQSAIQKLKKLPKGSKIISRTSRCDERVDLSGYPYQLFFGIKVKIPA